MKGIINGRRILFMECGIVCEKATFKIEQGNTWVIFTLFKLDTPKKLDVTMSLIFTLIVLMEIMLYFSLLRKMLKIYGGSGISGQFQWSTLHGWLLDEVAKLLQQYFLQLCLSTIIKFIVFNAQKISENWQDTFAWRMKSFQCSTLPEWGTILSTEIDII